MPTAKISWKPFWHGSLVLTVKEPKENWLWEGRIMFYQLYLVISMRTRSQHLGMIYRVCIFSWVISTMHHMYITHFESYHWDYYGTTVWCSNLYNFSPQICTVTLWRLCIMSERPSKMGILELNPLPDCLLVPFPKNWEDLTITCQQQQNWILDVLI